ncbi:hypothetical protein PR048_018280 [Dryococelus australis]|uniref:Winged helix-turn-helix domain-containing protein n=1 Tax=Dryococelus australis TaxID=614101 RepID=A0ABQ9HBZ8_9NEOP|nr:hypothetical protein PR048_018280 [Dryococelus australis]
MHGEVICTTYSSSLSTQFLMSLVVKEPIQAYQKKIFKIGIARKAIMFNKTVQACHIETKAKPLVSTQDEEQLKFCVWLRVGRTGDITRNSSLMFFIFIKQLLDGFQTSHNFQDSFDKIIKSQETPADTVHYLWKIVQLALNLYSSLKKLIILLTLLACNLICDKWLFISVIAVLSEEKVLELLESAYPNPVTLVDMARENGWSEEEVSAILATLQEKGLVKPLEHGVFTRVGQGDTEIQVVKQMPTMTSSKQPTIAIITAQYCEKLAVDAMIENKETFVRYTTVGESNVYTLGNIGAHRIVCTKLPTVGHTREAMTAAGNTTTRLLGTFQKVDYVFLVGVGGGIPHFTDYNKHVRLGDVVVSYPINGHKYVYIYCENTKKSADGNYEFETKAYSPANPCLQDIAVKLKSQVEHEDCSPPWMQYLQDGLVSLRSDSEQDFSQPSPETDKLYMSIGDRDLIEVAHPAPLDGVSTRLERGPKLHLSPVASGRAVAREDQLRQRFSDQFGALAFDSEFDAVVESVIGNCRDSFVCLRGIADYKDGTRRKEWQPYASLVAASVMKTIICGMDPPSDV